MIYEKLAYLLSAHIPLIDALIILKQYDIIDEFKKGKALSSILKERGCKVFIVSRLAQGEKTAALHEACSDIALVLRKEKEIKNKLLITLLYPAVLFLVTSSIVVFLVAYIFPKMTPLFMSMKTSLPFTTKTVLFVSDSVIHFWWIYILFAWCIFTVIYMQRDFILYKIPATRYQKISQYFSRIGSYIESGIGLDEASSECAAMEESKYFRAILLHIATCVRQGISFSYVIEKHAVFPKEIASMLVVGEGSGRLGAMCKKIGEIYEHKFSDYTKAFTSAVEPISMLGMGLVVGFIALSMITPLYSITQHVQ